MNDILDQPTTSSGPLKYRGYVLAVWLAVFLIGGLFREMHWPFANILRVGGSAFFTAFALTQCFVFGVKQLLNSTALVIALVWVVWIITGAVFRDGYPFNWTGIAFFGVFFAGALLWFGIFSFVRVQKHRRRSN